MHNYDCITRRAVFRNVDERPHKGPDSSSKIIKGSSKLIQKASSVTADFDLGFKSFHMTHLTGT
jgi:hypothetical protein